MQSKSSPIAILLAGFALIAAAPAPAATVVVSTRVNYADLDVSSPAGAQAMLARIETAARQLCADHSDSPLAVYNTRGRAACQARTVARAVGRLDQPLVSRLYAAKTAPTALSAR